jgi:serpin B
MKTASAVRGDFASRLYNALAAADPARNLFLSPFSVQMALAMCAAGARGETRRVLADLLGAPLDVAEQNRQFAARLATLQSAGNSNVSLTIANALWVQKGRPLHPDYQKGVAGFYGGTCSELDFVALPDQAVKSINAWVESNSAGKIKDLIQRQLITRDTRLVLTNAIYFKGKWADEFDKSHTWDEDWHGASGARKTPMMHRMGGYLYHEGADFKALDLPYQGEQLSLLVVLPKKNDGLAALERQWADGHAYPQVTASLAHEESVIVALPRFKMETESQLGAVLCGLGAGVAFQDDADFSGISSEPLKISEVVHKAFIEVNEEGTEAAAATGVVMAKMSAVESEPKQFIADHPFFFLIRDRKTNAVLFSGHVLEAK